GAMSMAAGEYVSVSSQADTENADMAREREELATQWDVEREELADIYVARGVERGVAEQVAVQLMAHDALGAHARDELGIIELLRANPLQAAMASAASFFVGGVLPVLLTLFTPIETLSKMVIVTSLASLAVLGWISAKAGGASEVVAMGRVTFWGALAMALTYGVGRLVGGAG
ncbi:MAG: VIT1/CCC1 transporter family protein, partial [Gemmatimonadaceae bacterium]